MFKFDLQLFAESAANTTSATKMSPEIRTFYAKELLKNFAPNLVHLQFGKRVPMAAGNGKSVEFRKIAPLSKATTALTEGVTPDATEMQFTKITATLHQHGGFTTYTDVLQYAMIDPTISTFNEALAAQGSLTMDSVCRDILNATTNVMYCSKKSASGETAVSAYANMDSTCVLDLKEVFKAVNVLKRKNAKKIGDSYVCIAHPDVITALMVANLDNGWIDVAKYAHAEKIFNGEVGKIAGCRFIETSEAKITDQKAAADTSSKMVYSSLFIGADAYGIVDPEGMGMESIVKELGETGYDPLNQRGTIGWKAMQATAILNPEYLLKVESMTDIVTGATAN